MLSSHRMRIGHWSDLIVDVLGFDFQLLLAGFANPVMFSIDEGVIVDAFAVILGAEIAFHTRLRFYRT